MKLKQTTIGLTILLIFAAFILGSKMTGYWSTQSTKTPVKIQTGAFAGEYNPEDIRGSYTFTDVENAFEVPVSVLAEAFSIPDAYNASTFMNKDLEGLYALDGDIEIGNGSVKLFVALYTGLPYDYAGSGDYLPVKAVHILSDMGKLNEDQALYLDTHQIDLSSLSFRENPTADPTHDSVSESESLSNTVGTSGNHTDSSTEAPSPELSESETSALQIKGKTIFKEILDAGLNKEEISEILGLEMGHELMEVRTFCIDNGLSFSTIKPLLQEAVDSLNQ